MNLTKAYEYAVLIMIALAKAPPESVVSRKEIAEKGGMPSHYIAKIGEQLKKFGLIRVHKGSHGGFEMLCGLDTNLYEIYQATSGDLEIHENFGEELDWVFNEVNDALISKLEQFTLGKLIDDTNNWVEE